MHSQAAMLGGRTAPTTTPAGLCPAASAVAHGHTTAPHQPRLSLSASVVQYSATDSAAGSLRNGRPALARTGTVARALSAGAHWAHWHPSVGPIRALAAASAALVGDGLADPDGFMPASASAASLLPGSVPDAFLDAPTAEVRMSTASERAAATCAVGPTAAARMQADCIRAVRSWCKLSYTDHIVVHVEHQQLAFTSTPGLLTSAAATFAGPDGRRHAAIAIAVGVRCTAAAAAAAASQPPRGGGGGAGSPPPSPGRVASPPTAPGSGAPVLDPLPGLSLHWGCCHGPGQRWFGAAPGWHTRPAVSYDAGRGAWQTPLALRQAIPLEEEFQQPGLAAQGGTNAEGPQQPGAGEAAAPGLPGGPWVAAYSLLLQVPWEGPLRNGGICFVLKTARNQWIKARAPSSPARSGDGGGGGRNTSNSGDVDFWLGTSGLPLVAHGTPLLPDVFRSSASDSMPQVFLTPPVPEPAPFKANGSANGHGHADGHGNGHANGHANVASSSGSSSTALAAASVPASPPAATAPPAHAHAPTPTPTPTPAPPAPASAPTTNTAVTSTPATSTTATTGSDSTDTLDLLGAAACFRAPPRHSDSLLRPAERHPLPAGGGNGNAGGLAACGWMVEQIAVREPGAERSLMHRYNTGADLVAMAAGSAEMEGALAAITAWLRLSSARLLVWNRNYNVKPREISTAQARLAAALARLGATHGPVSSPSASSSAAAAGQPRGGRGSAAVGSLVRVALAAVGRGGAGEVGQRIRDEILAIQQRNNCKGGMMEEWHQKLHNNTSPDDVVICKALLDYIAAGLDITAYWRTLAGAGITAQRLASFDRPIVSEPRFSGQQAAGLQRDLAAYLQTLQAVHGGDDLRSAVNNVLGYEETDMKGKRIVVPPVPSVASPALSRHLRSLLALQRHLATSRPAGQPGQQPAPTPSAAAAAAARRLADPASGGAAAAAAASSPRPREVASLTGLPGSIRLMEMLLEGRHLIRPFLEGGEEACGGRLVDVAFLDLALDSALRTSLEGHMGALRAAIADATAVHIAAAAVEAAGPRVSDGGGVSGIAAAAAAAAASAGGRPLAGALEASAALTQVLEVVRLAVENAALSSCPNDDLVYSNKWLRLLVAQEDPRDAKDRMLQALAICDRVKRALADQAAATLGLLQPPADALAARLGLPPGAVSGLGEEAARGGSGAPLAQLLAAVEPPLRRATGGGAWQIVSRGSDRPVLAGRLRVEPRGLGAVQHERMSEPTVLLVEGVTGAEEIPEGCVAVLVAAATADGGGGGGGAACGCPDVLSHSAVRARNMGVLLAGCYDPELVAKMRANSGGRVMVRLEGSEVRISFSSSKALGGGGGDGAASGASLDGEGGS